MFIACKKCKYNYEGECHFYIMGSGNEIDMPCYREKELKESIDNFLQAFVGTENEDTERDVLDKIISESISLKLSYTDHDKDTYRRGVNDVIKIIDKYRGK